MLLAQAGGEVAAWTGIVAALVNMGFSAVVAWWLLTRSIPHMLDTFLKALQSERDIFSASELRRSNDSKEKIQLIVSEHKAAVQQVVVHCERESERRDKVLALEMSTVNKSLVSVGEVLEEVRDVLRNRNNSRTKG